MLWVTTEMKWNPNAKRGPDVFGRYFYLGDPANLSRARACIGHPIRSHGDLQAIAPILREDLTWSCSKPQTYVVTVDSVFVLGGYLNEHVEVASGEPVLAAGEATLEELPDGAWRITALNNRSYGYMPEACCWAAVERSLSATGVEYPRGGFTEIYPSEGSWEDVLATLLE